MRKLAIILFAMTALSMTTVAQPKPRPTPRKPVQNAPAKTAANPEIDRGVVSGRTYSNYTFGFEIVFPDSWLIPVEDHMKKQGFDLRLKAPDSLTPVGQAKVNQALRQVAILLTAYSSMPGATDNAFVRISVENLAANPQIKDAVDYFDAIRATYKAMKLPADFKYSETQAERLGAMQFAFLDTSTKAGKKRMYATVRRGYAVMFTISYSKDGDLASMRRILEEGNFSLKRP